MPEWKPGIWSGSKAAWSKSHAGVIDPEDISDPIGEHSAFDPAESPVVRPEGWCGHPSCHRPNCVGHTRLGLEQREKEERDGEAARQAVDAINADTSQSVVAQLVGGEERDDNEGLPPMADGWEWFPKPAGIGGCVKETEPGGTTCQHCYARPGTAQAGRHLLARHDRQYGYYWADEFRALAGKLNAEADGLEPVFAFPSPGWARKQGGHRSLRDAAHRILAILDRLHAEGVC